MVENLWQRMMVICLVIALILITTPLCVSGDDSAEKLQAAAKLRQDGKHEEAIEALSRLAADMSAPARLRGTAQFELGKTLIEQSRVSRDPMVRNRILQRAQDVLEQYVQEHKGHASVIAAQLQLGNAHAEFAQQVFRSKPDPKNLSKSEREQARAGFGQAEIQFEASATAIANELRELGVVPPADREKRVKRDRLRAEYLQAQLMAPLCREQRAATHDATSKKRRELLQSSADDLIEIYEKYRTRIAGLYALMYAGRCRAELGECPRAIAECFEPILENDPSIAPIRTLQVKTALRAYDCWTDGKAAGRSKGAEAMRRLFEHATEAELAQKDWLQLRVNLAQLLLTSIKQFEMKESLTDLEKAGLEKARSEALTHAKFAAEHMGAHQAQAKKIFAAINRK